MQVIINPGSSRLHASTIWIDDPGPLTDFLCAEDACFLRGSDGFVALGEVARHESTSMTEADAWWRQMVSEIEQEFRAAADAASEANA